MDYLAIIFGSNLMGTLYGWLAWAALLWHIEKNKHDERGEPFPFSEYRKKMSDDWISSFLFIPVILWVGARSLALDPFVNDGAGWSDLYYLCAGLAPQAVVRVLKKFDLIKP